MRSKLTVDGIITIAYFVSRLGPSCESLPGFGDVSVNVDATSCFGLVDQSVGHGTPFPDLVLGGRAGNSEKNGRGRGQFLHVAALRSVSKC